MNRRGMTLIELVVGLTVAGTALATAYAAFAALLDQGGRVQESVSRIGEAAAVRRQLLAWLAGARLRADEAGPAFQGVDGWDAEVPADEFTFLTVASGPDGPVESVVRLYVDRDTTTAETGLLAEITPWRTDATELVVLVPNVGGLEFRYFTRMIGTSGWLPSWISSTVLPAAVEMTLIPAPGTVLPSILQAPLLVPLGGAR